MYKRREEAGVMICPIMSANLIARGYNPQVCMKDKWKTQIGGSVGTIDIIWLTVASVLLILMVTESR